MGVWAPEAWPNLRATATPPLGYFGVFLPSTPTAYGQPMPCSILPPYPSGTHSKAPSRCLKLQTLLNPTHTVFFPIHTYLCTKRKHYMASPPLLLCLEVIIKENKGDLNTSTAIPQQSIWSWRRLLSDCHTGSVCSVAAPDHRMSYNLGWTAQDCITLLKMEYNLKLMNCLFLEFST